MQHQHRFLNESYGRSHTGRDPWCTIQLRPALGKSRAQAETRPAISSSSQQPLAQCASTSCNFSTNAATGSACLRSSATDTVDRMPVNRVELRSCSCLDLPLDCVDWQKVPCAGRTWIDSEQNPSRDTRQGQLFQCAILQKQERGRLYARTCR